MRDEIICEYERAAAAISNATTGLSEEQASRPEIDVWSVKDHLSHVTLWHEMRFFEIGRCSQGRRPAFPGGYEDAVQTINQTFASLRRHLSLEDVLSDLEFARGWVIRAIAEAPEERLDPSLYEEMGPAGGAQHELAHAEVIFTWRQKEGL